MRLSGNILEEYEKAYAAGNSVMLSGREIGAPRKADNIVSLCSSSPHNNIIEIGAGDGAVLNNLSLRGFGTSFTAVEISASAVERIRSRRIESISAILFDGAELPFPDQSFDLALLSHVVEHLENPRQLIKEAARVARSVFIEVPLEDTRGAGKSWHKNPEGHINYYTFRSIRFLVQSCGLTLRKQRITDWAWSTYRFENGVAKGMIKFIVKRLALSIAPHLATKLFTLNLAITAAR